MGQGAAGAVFKAVFVKDGQAAALVAHEVQRAETKETIEVLSRDPGMARKKFAPRMPKKREHSVRPFNQRCSSSKKLARDLS
jgi:hypothetical protein